MWRTLGVAMKMCNLESVKRENKSYIPSFTVFLGDLKKTHIPLRILENSPNNQKLLSEVFQK